uniref:UD11 glucuronosyltransferase n=1 Tax=Calidris pygmaea TaxID=425635 RepID=A0A8C3JH85_9CHAR
PAHNMLVAVLLLFLCCLGPAGAGKLLVVPMEGSHWLSMKEVLAELSRRGHEIVVVAPDSKMLIDSSGMYELKTYPVPFKKEEMEELIRSFGANCFSEDSLLYNKGMMKYIKESKFDAIFTDPLTPCGQIIALHFSIPSVFFLRGVPCAIDIHAAQSPNPPSYIPRMFSLNTDHMTFPQRVKNFLLDISESFTCSMVFSPFESLASDFLQKPMTITQLLSHGSIWLKRLDFVFEYPMPVMPNMIFIGGINCGQKKPLSQVSDWLGRVSQGKSSGSRTPGLHAVLCLIPAKVRYTQTSSRPGIMAKRTGELQQLFQKIKASHKKQ